jgi:hypothetical protein
MLPLHPAFALLLALERVEVLRADARPLFGRRRKQRDGLRATFARALRGRSASVRPPHPAGDATVLVRAASPDDRGALAELAVLDDATVPPGRLLVAEVDGHVVAALGLESGTPLADPFRPAAEAIELLQLRAAQLRAARPVRPGSTRVRASATVAP